MTPHQRIMHAAAKGSGIRLSASECAELSRDQAIAQCALNDDEDEATAYRNRARQLAKNYR